MAILLTNGFFLYQTSNGQIESSSAVEQAHEVMEAVDQITFHLSDAENARRGFILTSSTRYLAHFKTATNHAAADYSQLKRLTANDPVQQTKVDGLKSQINKRFQILSDSIQWQQEHGPDAETQAAFMDIGQQAMEPVRQTCGFMLETQRKLLEKRRTEALKGIHDTAQMTLIGTGISMGILSWAFLMLVRENVRRSAAEEAIRMSNDELEQRVAVRTQDLAAAAARAEQAHEFRDKVMESAVFGCGALDVKGNFTRVNQHFADIMGYRVEEMIDLSYVQLVSMENLAVLSKYFFRVINNRSSVLNREIEVLRKDGSTACVAFSWSPMTMKGEVIGVVGTAMDVTAHLKAEAEIRRLNRELEKRVTERTSQLEAFSYSVSHDLRAPLRHVDGFVAMLRQHAVTSLDDKGRRYQDIISDSARQMGTLIDDLLDFSRVGRSELKWFPVDMNQLVQEALRDLAPDLRARDIKWTIDTLPTARADRAMLKLVWVNLLSTAVKYTRPRTRAEIEIGSRSIDDGQGEYFVRDNRVGFDMRYAEKLFGVFQRLHRADEFEGPGIGLANVRRIVIRHGGAVRAESVLNEGATFSFTLPLGEPEPT